MFVHLFFEASLISPKLHFAFFFEMIVRLFFAKTTFVSFSEMLNVCPFVFLQTAFAVFEMFIRSFFLQTAFAFF